eukprot:Pgem_evm1s15375
MQINLQVLAALLLTVYPTLGLDIQKEDLLAPDGKKYIVLGSEQETSIFTAELYDVINFQQLQQHGSLLDE